jgi:hypothetical protein
MASEIEVLEDTTTSSTSLVAAASTAPSAAEGAGAPAENESLKNDVYTAAAYGDLEKLQRLVEGEGRPVTEPDGGGYYALQWAALNNRVAAAQYILEVALSPPLPCPLQRLAIWPSICRRSFSLLLGDLGYVPVGCDAMHFLSWNFVYQNRGLLV